MAWRYKGSRFQRGVRRYGRFTRRANRRIGVLGMSGAFIAGAAVGLTDYDKMIPYEVKIAVACLPSAATKMIPGAGALVQLCRGMLIGDIVQAKTGFNLGGAAGSAGFQGV